MSCSTVPEMHTAKEKGRIVITSIRATNLALGLGRIPAGFFTVIHHSGLEWRTESKPILVNNDVVEWNETILMPLDLCASVSLAVHASFEFQPMLGNGERLRVLTVSVEQLLQHSASSLAFTFPEIAQDRLPCSSILVAARQQENDSLASLAPAPHRSLIPDVLSQLEDATDHASSAFLRYQKHKEEWDLDHSIERFQYVLDICPLDHPCLAAARENLARAKFLRCVVHDPDPLLDVPITLYQNALLARPAGHPDRPRTLVRLATAFLARFRKRRDDVDAASADALLYEAIDLSSVESHEHQIALLVLESHKGYTMVAQLSNQLSLPQGFASSLGTVDPRGLSILLLDHSNRVGGLAMLQQAISILKISIKITSMRDRQYPVALSILGAALYYRFCHFGEQSDLEDGISRQRDAVDLIPDGCPSKQNILSGLANSLCTRFQRFGQIRDLEEAISQLQNAVDTTPDGNSHKVCRLRNLARCHRIRFERLGEPSDLEGAISRQRDIINITPDGHPDKPVLLNELGASLGIRFQHFRGLDDLEEAISTLQAATDMPDDDPRKPGLLGHLGISHFFRFRHVGQPHDLERAILRQQNAVDLTPDRHPAKPVFLINLSNSLMARYERYGGLSDLDAAITRQRDVVDLTLDGHPDKPCHLHTLGNSLASRFQRLGELRDLEETIARRLDAVRLTTESHRCRSNHLISLGNAFGSRFDHLGELSDLEEAILRHQEAVDLTPDGHPRKPSLMNNLGTSLRTRSDRLGEPRDLEHAISMQRGAVNLTPDGDSDKPLFLMSLGTSLQTRFEHSGQLSDLEEAISMQRGAIDQTPDGHPYLPGFLTNLGVSLADRFKHFGNLCDLEEVIARQECATTMTPDGHPHKPVILQNLGNHLLRRFRWLGELTDLDEAISRQQDAADLISDGHPRNSGCLNSLGESLLARFKHLGEVNDLEKAISSYSHSAYASTSPVSDRFHASLQWISCSRLLGHSRAHLRACSVAILLLSQLPWIGLTLAHRYRELAQAADVVRDAAAAALDCGQPETAVEWLEQGRSVVWGEMFQLRSSFDELSPAYPDHARKLRKLSIALEHASAAHERFVISPLGQARGADHHCTVESLQRSGDQHRRLAIERDKLIHVIRTLPGFEQFLLHKEFSQLRAVAHTGPVVILNAAKARCDALIVLAGVDHVIHVPLPNFTLQRSINLQTSLKGCVRHARDDRQGHPVPQEGSDRWMSILATLWKCVVKPVLDALALSIPGELSRIFWCPTGPFTFLPLHAAGFYDKHHSQPGHKVFDFVMSSYIPTLGLLAPLQPNPTPSNDLCLLTVPQPLSDGLHRLPGVVAELEHINMAVKSSPSSGITLVESSAGTVEEVLSLMKETDWVHFACHGVQDAENPTESGLCLADQRRLRLSDLVSLSRPRGGLAFLSACQTAKGDENLSDEAIHIAAAMLYAGYGGVVGTMWSISDRYAPNVARDVYEQLFSDGTRRPDYRDAARALHVAVARLRDRNNVPFQDWLPFIHVGL